MVGLGRVILAHRMSWASSWSQILQGARPHLESHPSGVMVDSSILNLSDVFQSLQNSYCLHLDFEMWLIPGFEILILPVPSILPGQSRLACLLQQRRFHGFHPNAARIELCQGMTNVVCKEHKCKLQETRQFYLAVVNVECSGRPAGRS
jgi:hypothetical protein